MTDKPVSPLRQRMIEDMTVRHFKRRSRRTTFVTSRTSRIFSAAPRHRDQRGSSPFSITYDEEPCWRSEHQLRDRRAPVLFQGDTRTA